MGAEVPSLSVEIAIFCASDFCRSVYGLASEVIMMVQYCTVYTVQHLRS